MKNKTIISVLITFLLCFFLVIPSSWAGSKQRHRWEGVAIGVGAVFLGSVLLNHYGCPPKKRVQVYHYSPPPRNWSHYSHEKPHYWPHYTHKTPHCYYPQWQVRPHNPHYRGRR